ncbi:ParB N-terminal domain-containing protein [Selenomonas artemidis]|uniref:ParB/RepB/Spo0J family partition protein n=1 Tax=Selenomonas artemidis TaxID=671224 RepID=UPI0028EB6712|nr:ParB N-terminal domain-containing protein [Selenomonas artemidis]
MKKGVILQIPLELLEEDPYNFFETVGSVEIEEKNAELMDSIEEDGLLHPIVIRPANEEESRFFIISGVRRYQMYRRLHEQGKEEYGKIPCVIRNIKDPLQVRRLLIEANTSSRDLSDWEKAKAVEAYGAILEEMKAAGAEMPGRRRDHIAAALKMSKTTVGKYEHINKNLSDEYKEEMKAGNIGISVADKLAGLPEEKQKEMHKKTGGNTRLADFTEKKIFADPDDQPQIYEVKLLIPPEQGHITVKIAEFDGKYYGGGGGASADGRVTFLFPWQQDTGHNTYEEAFDAILDKMAKEADSAPILAGREKTENAAESADWEQESGANPDFDPDVEINAQTEIVADMEKQAAAFAKVADVAAEEGRPIAEKLYRRKSGIMYEIVRERKKVIRDTMGIDLF